MSDQFSAGGSNPQRDTIALGRGEGTSGIPMFSSPGSARRWSAGVRPSFTCQFHPVAARPLDGDRPKPKDDDGKDDDGETAEDRVPVGTDQHLRATQDQRGEREVAERTPSVMPEMKARRSLIGSLHRPSVAANTESSGRGLWRS
jgi:hypothetical protein